MKNDHYPQNESPQPASPSSNAPGHHPSPGQPDHSGNFSAPGQPDHSANYSAPGQPDHTGNFSAPGQPDHSGNYSAPAFPNQPGFPPQAPPNTPGYYPPPGYQPQQGQYPPFVPPTLADPFLIWKKAIRRDLMVILLVVAAYYAAQMIFSAVFIMIQMFMGGAFSAIMEAATSNVDPSTGQLDMEQYLNDSMSAFGAMDRMPGGIALTQLLIVIVSFPLFFIVAGKRWFSEYVPRVNQPMKANTFLQIFVIAMSAQLIFTILSILFDLLLGQFGYSMTKSYEATMNMMKTPIGYAYIMVIGPISEELIFRGAIMRRLERHGVNFAIVVSALIFGLFHMILIQSMFAFIVGIILGYTAQRYSLKWAILLHILINSSSSLMDMIPNGGTVTMLIMGAFFAGAVAICVKRRGFIQEEIRIGRTEKFPAPCGSPYGIAFSSVFLILYMILTILSGVAMILGVNGMVTPGT